MNSRVIGSILLIVAMSIGGGLLSLPVVTAASGFFHSSLLLIVIWLVITLGALFILEVCLWLPKGTNLVFMAGKTLGMPGQVFTWCIYLLMMYCIMCVYISGGTDLFHSIWQSLHVRVVSWISTVLFVLIFGGIVWQGIKLVDYANRALMGAKMLAYVLLVALLVPAVHVSALPAGSFKALPGAMMPAVFSFGYATIIPSLRSYLHSNIRQLQLAVLIGSVIPLLCFIAWNYTVQGTMSQQQLIGIAHSGNMLSQLNAGLSAMGNPWVTTIIHVFTTVCILTAFLSVALSLSDFIANGIQREKEGFNKWLIHGLAFLPPLAIVLFRPDIFIEAIRYAGILVVILLLLLPTLMVWRGRRHETLAQGARFRVPGGSMTTSAMLVIAVVLLLVAVMHL